MVSLHEKFITETGRDGQETKIRALDPSRVQDVDYVYYKPPPVDGADRAAVEEWLERVKYIEEDLHWLLRLSHSRFWCQIIFDNKVHQFIDSYLCDAPRQHDMVVPLPPSRALPSQVTECLATLNRLFFFVCLRASTHHESPTDIIDNSVFGAILYENYVFDIARLMDICAVYGHRCKTAPLVGKMIENVFTHQPKYFDDLKAVVPDMLQILESIQKKCGMLDITFPSPDRSSRTLPNAKLHLEKMPAAEFEDIILYFCDIAHTLNAFLAAYPASAEIFWNNINFPVRLAAAYESLSVAFTSAFVHRTWVDPERKVSLKKLFRRSQVCLLRVFRLAAYNACMKPIVENTSDSSIAGSYIENYLDVMHAVLSEKHFIAHLHILFPFSDDSGIMHSSTYMVDDVRLKYVQEACEDAVNKFVKHHTIKQRNSQMTDGALTKMQDQTDQYDDQSGITINDFEGLDVDDDAGACAAKMSGIEIDSMVSSVKDLLPDLGSGFVRLCLEEYDFNVERVVNAVLEDRLLPSLQSIDRSLAEVPGPMQSETFGDQHFLVENRQNIFDGDDFDVFSRNSVDTGRIHKGKRVDANVTGMSEMTSEIKKRIATYAYQPVDVVDVENGDVEGIWEYDDEYDDTYDSNAVGIHDADSADELLSRRSFVTPRIFGGQRGAAGDDVDDEESDDDDSLVVGAAPPRDAFVEDPAKIRQMREERYAAKQWNRRRGPCPSGPAVEAPRANHDVKGGPRGQGQNADVVKNRAWKEKNKSTHVHHNRKDLADRKRRV